MLTTLPHLKNWASEVLTTLSHLKNWAFEVLTNLHSYLNDLMPEGAEVLTKTLDLARLRQTAIQLEDTVREGEEIPKLLPDGLQDHVLCAKRRIFAAATVSVPRGGRLGHRELTVAVQLRPGRQRRQVREAPHQDHVGPVPALPREADPLVLLLLGLDHGEPEPELGQLLLAGLGDLEDQHDDGVGGAEKFLVEGVVAPQAGEVPDAEVARGWDGDLVDEDAVGALLDHVGDVGVRPPAEQAADEVALEGLDQLRLPHARGPADEELDAGEGDLLRS